MIREQLANNLSLTIARKKDMVIFETISDFLGFEPSAAFLIAHQEMFVCQVLKGVETYCIMDDCGGITPLIEIYPLEFSTEEADNLILNTSFKYRKLI